MIDLKELDAKSEELMQSLAKKDEDLIDLVLSPRQKLIGMSKSLAYIASLVISPNKVPPYSKEEERIFAKLQILYQQKKLSAKDDPSQQLQKRPQLFKLSPAFVPQASSQGETKTKIGTQHVGKKEDSSKEEARRMSIIKELLADEEYDKEEIVNNKKNHRKKHKKQRQRVIINQKLTTSLKKDSSISTSSDWSEKNENEISSLHSEKEITGNLNSTVSISSNNHEIRLQPTDLTLRTKPTDVKDTINSLSKNNATHSIKDFLDKNTSFMSQNENNISCSSPDEITCLLDQPNRINLIQSEQTINIFETSTTTMLEDSLRKEVLRLQSELNRSKIDFEKTLLMERQKFEKKLEEAIRVERENSEQRFQALQLRLYISDNRAQTLEDALDKHIAAVSHLPRRKQREGIGDTTL